jgi:hypothetical protein
MATWKKLKTFTYDDNANTKPNGNTEITVQYDADSVTPTQLRIRFLYDVKSGSTNYFDSMYVLYDPSGLASDESSDAQKVYDGTETPALLRFKKYTETSGVAWPYVAKDISTGDSIIKIAKYPTHDDFYIPTFWICNNGNTATSVSISNFKSVFGSSGARKNYKMVVKSGLGTEKRYEVATSKSTITDATPGSLKITDNLNNTFTIEADKGESGQNNPVYATFVKWGYDKNLSGGHFEVASNTASVTKTLDITTPANATRTVYAETSSKCLYNTPSAMTSKSINQYVAPNAPGKPVISFKKSRLTVKENWTYNWTAASSTNSNSPVAGYRVRLYRNGSQILQQETTGTSYTINPTNNKFEAGDTVRLDINPYTVDRKGTKILRTAYTASAISTVQHAGVVHARVDNAWKEGQVSVRVDNAWKEADVVYVRVDGAWVEAE